MAASAVADVVAVVVVVVAVVVVAATDSKFSYLDTADDHHRS